MKIKDEEVKKVIEKVIVDIDFAYRNAYSNCSSTRQHLCNAESRLTTILDLIDWEEQ